MLPNQLHPASVTVTASSAADATFSGIISGAFGLTKSGAGTLTLSGSSNYSGLTTVSVGTLRLNNARTMNGAIAVNTGATLTLESNSSGGYFQPSSLDVNNATVNSVVTAANRYHGIYTTALNITGTSTISTPIFISKTGITGETLTITVGSGATGTISGTILNHPDTAGGSLVKAGSGTLTLTGTTQASGNSTTLTGNVTISTPISGTGGITHSHRQHDNGRPHDHGQPGCHPGLYRFRRGRPVQLQDPRHAHC